MYDMQIKNPVVCDSSKVSLYKKITAICLPAGEEALPGGGGGYLFPCSPEINWLVPLFPKNRKFVFLCSLFPNIVFVPLFPSEFGLCSPEINTLFPPVPQNPWEGLREEQVGMYHNHIFTKIN